MSFQEQIELVRERIHQSTRPVILFDDDPDGLASFLIIYRMIRSGKGMPLKGSPLNEEFAQKVNEYQPDLVIILDKAAVAQEFFDKIRTDCIWIDHHSLQEPKGVLYLNPQTEGKNIPTSSICYEIAQEDAWIAAVGTVADWQLPNKNLWDAINKEYPLLLPDTIQSAPEALFETPVGTLARVFSFNLKGKINDVLISLKILSRINNPYELLEKQHAQAKLVMKKYEKMLGEYQDLLEQAKEHKKGDLLIFTYSPQANSFTPDLSNELLALFPTTAIIIARETNGSYKCSIRDNTRNIEHILQTVLTRVPGDGGGHEHACGAIIPEEHFEEFVEEFSKEINRNALK